MQGRQAFRVHRWANQKGNKPARAWDTNAATITLAPLSTSQVKTGAGNKTAGEREREKERESERESFLKIAPYRSYIS